MQINNRLLSEITEYCKINNIEDIDTEINKYISIGFNIERYGVSPFQRMEIQPLPLGEEVSQEEKPKAKRGRKPKTQVQETVISETIEQNTQVVSQEPIEKKKTKIRIIKN